MRFILVISLASLVVGACGLLPEVQDETKTWSASKLYSEGKDEVASANYERAIKLFETLEARYPYGRYAQQAQIETVYAYYKSDEPALAIAAADRFIKLHPNHPHVDYVYYMKGLVNFNEDLGYLAFISRQDLTERDPKAARDSFFAFKELVTRYPQSKYAPDAEARMRYLLNALAAHEIHVARYYFKRGAYIAAANRVQYALTQYPQAPTNEEGLLIMVKSYDALGMAQLRDDAERILKHNFPDSRYLSGAGSSESWWKLW
ncbi:MAG: outer membrane protein assembly factor BamD [Burkholderiales bacterium]